MKKIFINIFISAVLAVFAVYTTNFISYHTKEYDIDPTKCIDCVTGYRSFGFPFEAVRYISGGFTGSNTIPRIGLIVNFTIYFFMLFVVIYFLSKKRPGKIVNSKINQNLE